VARHDRTGLVGRAPHSGGRNLLPQPATSPWTSPPSRAAGTVVASSPCIDGVRSTSATLTGFIASPHDGLLTGQPAPGRPVESRLIGRPTGPPVCGHEHRVVRRGWAVRLRRHGAILWGRVEAEDGAGGLHLVQAPRARRPLQKRCRKDPRTSIRSPWDHVRTPAWMAGSYVTQRIVSMLSWGDLPPRCSTIRRQTATWSSPDNSRHSGSPESLPIRTISLTCSTAVSSHDRPPCPHHGAYLYDGASSTAA
jgi:hypothetical protein